jgi:tetratricopeptide (TPR) repeat protein
MTFQEVLAQVIDWLQREQRLSYRAIKRQFALDEDYREDLKEELLYAKRLAVDEENRVLVWSGGAAPVVATVGEAGVGAFPEALAVGEEGLHIAEAVGHPTSLMLACRGVGLPPLYKGHAHTAIPMLERALGICQGTGLRLYVPIIAAFLGAAYTLVGRLSDAVALLEQAAAQAAAMKLAWGRTLVMAHLSEALRRADRLEDAFQVAGQALAFARGRKERGVQAWILRMLEEIRAHCTPLDVGQAATHYQQALALATELGMRPLQAHCHRGLGTLYSQTGQAEQARAELSTAVNLYRDMAMTFWLPETEAALAEVEER